MKKLLVTLVFFAIVVFGLIPYESTLVPRWKVRLVDEIGNPYQRHYVRQHCKNFTLQINPCGDANDSAGLTDQAGYIVFPARIYKLSLITRLGNSFESYLFLFAHGSVGSVISLDSTGPLGYKRIDWVPGKPLPDKFVLPTSKPQG